MPPAAQSRDKIIITIAGAQLHHRANNYGKNLQVLHFDPTPPPEACDVSEV